MRACSSLLTAALLAAGAGPAPAGRPVPLTEARSLLEAAARRCDVRSESAAPLRLRASLRALRLSSGEHAGRYELAWEGLERWRLEIRFDGYHSIDVRNETGEWSASAVPYTPVRVHQLREGLDVAGLLALQPGEVVIQAESMRVRGGRRLQILIDGGRRGPRTIELDEEAGLPVRVTGQRLSHHFSSWESVGEAAFPLEISVEDEEGPLATAKVRHLAREPFLPPALFREPGQARRTGEAREPDDPAWEAYRERLARFFQGSWQLPREAQLGLEGVVRLGFSVRTDGEIEGLRLLESSGHEALDRAALLAIAAASPLPSPPLEAGAEALTIAWTVAYNLADGAQAERARRFHGTRPISGTTEPGFEELDELMLSFLDEQDAPGAALAVAEGERLMVARGYGWTSAESLEPMQPESSFRIASLSKSLTAMTVLALAEDGLVSLDEPVWPLLGLAELAEAVDPRHGRLTVLHLLQHRGGFDSRRGLSDELLAAEAGRSLDGGPAPTPSDVVDELARRSLDFEPGARFAYSNAGYLVLGRVIEAVSGRAYEDAVRERLLQPLGLQDTRLGHGRERAPGEVRPHQRDEEWVPASDGSGQLVPLAEGGFAVESLEAHGGWLSSAVELVRLSAALDEPRRSGVLSRRSVRRLWDRPPGRAGRDADGRLYSNWYGCGWHVRARGPLAELEQWHDGQLPGGSALMVREVEGWRWVVLFNQDRGADGKMLAAAVEPRIREALRRLKAGAAAPRGVDPLERAISNGPLERAP